MNGRPYRPRWCRPHGDSGMSLIEVTVSMVIMSVVMVVFTTAVISIYRTSGRVQTLTEAQTGVNIAYLRLDREIRYAAAISDPATTGEPDVAYLTLVTGAPMCTELRLHTRSGDGVRELRWRQWRQSTTPRPAFVTLVPGVSDASPFTVSADATSNRQRLEIRLGAVSQPGNKAVSPPRQTDVTFTALNSDATTSTSTVCTEGRTDSDPG